MILQQFINAGWHTVPLGGKLVRLDKGKKSIPKFEAEWKKLYAKKFNDRAVPLGGALTGSISGILAIDCDSQATYNIFRELDPTNKFLFPSKGKLEGGGTIIYKYNKDIPSFSIPAEDGFALDVFSDEGFIYLPTEDNDTKEAWTYTELPKLTEIPAHIVSLLMVLSKKKTVVEASVVGKARPVAHRLAPLVKTFLAKQDAEDKQDRYSSVLFKIITPKDFRVLNSYASKGHLHPEDIPQGRGSEYLSKISWIFGADVSIDKFEYTKAMYAINNLWSHPMDIDRLNKTIVHPMIEGRKIRDDGSPVWQYDPHWETHGFVATSKRGDYIESFFDDREGAYYLINHTEPFVKRFKDKRPVINTLKQTLGSVITETGYDSTSQLVRTVVYPALEFGHVAGTGEFNLFRQTECLNILNYPASYKEQYHRPVNTIRYLETLVPDEQMRSYLLSFMRTKLTTFKYSPVIVYFLGVQGSGKNTFIDILGDIIGIDYIAEPNASQFTEKHNGDLKNKYIVHLADLGRQLSSHKEREKVLGLLKAISGSPNMQLREMNCDGISYAHSITFFLTENKNAIPWESGDRRVAFISTPNVLAEADWVLQAGGVSDVYDAIRAEVQDFCYYLSTEVKSLSTADYQKPPYTIDKERLIINTMPARNRIAYYMETNNYRALEDLAIEHDIPDFTSGWHLGRLRQDKLFNLYSSMTEGNGKDSALEQAIKDAGFNKDGTSAKDDKGATIKRVFYRMPSLAEYRVQDGHTTIRDDGIVS